MQYVTEDTIPSFPLDLFPTNLEDISNNHGDSFHNDISTMEKQYYRKWNLAASSLKEKLQIRTRVN
jgi:hypothetical protein